MAAGNRVVGETGHLADHNAIDAVLAGWDAGSFEQTVNGKLPADLPNTYPTGISASAVTLANGWPGTGTVLTVNIEGSTYASQVLIMRGTGTLGTYVRESTSATVWGSWNAQGYDTQWTAANIPDDFPNGLQTTTWSAAATGNPNSTNTFMALTVKTTSTSIFQIAFIRGTSITSMTPYVRASSSGTTWGSWVRLLSDNELGGTPTNINPATTTAAEGTSAYAARADHVHGNVTPGTPTDSAPGDVAAPGSSSGFARGDHTHGRAGATGGVISYSTGWAQPGTSGDVLRYAKDDNLFVTIAGTAQNTSAYTPGGTIIVGVVPSGYRPQAAILFPVITSVAGVIVQGEVGTNGNIVFMRMASGAAPIAQNSWHGIQLFYRAAG